jgi:hypothetical protein
MIFYFEHFFLIGLVLLRYILNDKPTWVNNFLERMKFKKKIKKKDKEEKQVQRLIAKKKAKKGGTLRSFATTAQRTPIEKKKFK